ncbi:MAG: ATP-binding protein, partial [Streptosporangiaceae bacterium]
AAPSVVAAGPELDLASNDPLVGYLLGAASAVDITGLQLQSPALQALQEAGVVLVVPLISSGSLVGLLSLGPRRSERGYSTDDLRLLNSLAGYAAPAMRVGQLVRQQQAQACRRERIEQELKIAQIIQQQFLPKNLPDLPSWHVAAFYRPARTVAEATMNAIEHGNGNRPEIPVEVEVTQNGDEIIVAISDQGGDAHPGDGAGGHEEPDLVKKLDGGQSPRGWGLFLIRDMVDAMDVTTDGQRHTISLTMRTGGAAHDERM